MDMTNLYINFTSLWFFLWIKKALKNHVSESHLQSHTIHLMNHHIPQYIYGISPPSFGKHVAIINRDAKLQLRAVP